MCFIDVKNVLIIFYNVFLNFLGVFYLLSAQMSKGQVLSEQTDVEIQIPLVFP